MNARDNMHRTGSCTEGGFAKASARFGVVTAQGGWRKVTWGVVAGVAAVATAGSLMVPSAAIAAEWVDVGGNQYNAGTAAGDDAGTWSLGRRRRHEAQRLQRRRRSRPQASSTLPTRARTP